MKLLKPSVTPRGTADFFFRINGNKRCSNATHTTLLLTLMSDVSQEVIDEFFPEVPSVEELQEFIRIFEETHPKFIRDSPCFHGLGIDLFSQNNQHHHGQHGLKFRFFLPSPWLPWLRETYPER